MLKNHELAITDCREVISVVRDIYHMLRHKIKRRELMQLWMCSVFLVIWNYTRLKVLCLLLIIPILSSLDLSADVCPKGDSLSHLNGPIKRGVATKFIGLDSANIEYAGQGYTA